MEQRRKKWLFDGAMGTFIASRGWDSLPEYANLERQEEVLAIHGEYLAAGAEAIKTNTFAANTLYFPDPEELHRVIAAGCRLARTAAEGTGARVFADIGPIRAESAAERYLELAEIFLEEGMDAFLFETQSEAEPLCHAVRLIRGKSPESLICVSFAVTQDGYTQAGLYYKDLLEEAWQAGADLVGLNCLCGPAHLLNLIRDIPRGKYDLTAMPNSGYPERLNGRTLYRDNPDYFAEKLRDLEHAGVMALGGCCGTTPEHIRRYAAAASKAPRTLSAHRSAPKSASAPLKEPFPPGFVAAEIPVPQEDDLKYALRVAKSVSKAGADYITIPDSPMARSRANSVFIAALLQKETGIEAIPHLTCRDKNQIALKGDLLAGHIAGLSHVLAVTGDPLPKTERGSDKGVFSLNSFQLTAFIRSLNEVLFQDRPYTVTGALNTSAPRFDMELKRAEEKIRAGAVCLFTQPLYTQTNLENLRRAKETLDVKIAAGILPPAGYKNALFLQNEVPGVDIPESLLSSLRDKSPEEARELCVEYALRMIREAKPLCDGYYLMTPLRKLDYTLALIAAIKE